jgi:hypothetical protein
MGLFSRLEKRDPAEVLPATLPKPISFESHRTFVRSVLEKEVGLTAVGTQYVPAEKVPAGSPSVAYRDQLNSAGSPSQTVAAGYRFTPGTELSAPEAAEQGGLLH